MSEESFGKPVKWDVPNSVSSLEQPDVPGFGWKLSDETIKEIEELEAWMRRSEFNARFILLD